MMAWNYLDTGYDLGSGYDAILSDTSSLTGFQDTGFNWDSLGSDGLGLADSSYLDFGLTNPYTARSSDAMAFFGSGAERNPFELSSADIEGGFLDSILSGGREALDWVGRNENLLGSIAKVGLGGLGMYNNIQKMRMAEKAAKEARKDSLQNRVDQLNVAKINAADNMSGRSAIANILKARQGIDIDPAMAYMQRMREDVGYSPSGATPYTGVPVGGPLQVNDRSRSVLKAIQEAQGQPQGYAEGGAVSGGAVGGSGMTGDGTNPLILAQLSSPANFNWGYDPWAQQGRDIQSSAPAPWEWWKPGNHQYQSMTAQGMQVPQVNMSMPTPVPNAAPQGATIPAGGVQPDFITQLYRDILGREPEAAGRAYWEKDFGAELDDTERATFIQAAQKELSQRNAPTPAQNFAQGGPVMQGALSSQGALGLLRGGSTGQADDVNARLSHGEYVFDADLVAALGDGNTEAGAAKLDQLRENIRRHKRSAPASDIPPPSKSLADYMRGVK